MDLPTFRGMFPEFSGAPDAMIIVFINNSALEIDAAVWGAKTELGIGYLAAHRLATSPYGQNARLKADVNAKTTYYESYNALKREVSSGYRVC